MNDPKEPVRRISLSLPNHLADELDKLVQQSRLPNRSKLVASLLQKHIDENQDTDSTTVMAGTISLIYDAQKANLLEKLAYIEHQHIDECITSQHILLEDGHVMEVVLVQGPIYILHNLKNDLLACKGIISSSLTLTRKIIPQVHARQNGPNHR